MGGTTRTSAVAAYVVSTENSTTPSVPISVSPNVYLSHRSSQGMSHSLESHDSALLGSQSSQSHSLGVDKLLAPRVDLWVPLLLCLPLPLSFLFLILVSLLSQLLLLPWLLLLYLRSPLPLLLFSLLFLCSSSSRFHPSSFVRSVFRVYSLLSFVFLALLFSPSFSALFLFLVFLLLFCSSVGFSFLFFLFSFLLSSSSSSSSSWLPTVLSSLFLLFSSASSSSSYASFVRFTHFWCSFLCFSACLFASLLFLFAFLCQGFLLIGWAGVLSRECIGVVQRLSVAGTLVCTFGWIGFCWVNSLFFPSPFT